ncbi:EF-hand domain-containing protein [Kitasatospora sp. NPDC056327]|uniref:EF-hand domain-containing protein n=1 Tax=Kitasatospora sp. NPDC056327 TaxID=3345785 RepID=UPI0035DDEA83
MASGFQRRKLREVFTAFDTDGDGCLRKGDFEALAERWSRLPAVRRDPALRDRVEALMTGWWDHLLAVADTDRDGTVDREEFLALVDRLPALRDVVTATADTVFDAVDENGDGRISRDEHARLVDVWHGRSVDTADVFELLDLDGDGYLGRPEFALLWEQFWISADPSEPGNAMCGRVPER